MRVTVRFFAALKEIVGGDAFEIDLEEGASVGSVLAHFEREHPTFGRYRGRLLTARNLEYVREEEPLDDGDEVAVFPPVSGG